METSHSSSSPDTPKVKPRVQLSSTKLQIQGSNPAEVATQSVGRRLANSSLYVETASNAWADIFSSDPHHGVGSMG